MSDDFVPTLKPLPDPDSARGSSSRRPELPVAGVLARATALAMDLAILTAVFYFLAHYAYNALYSVRHVTEPVAAILVFAYFWIGNGPLTYGQTVGKKLSNLRTIGRDGANLTWRQAALRAFFVLILVYAYASLSLLFPIIPWRTFAPPAEVAVWLGSDSLSLAGIAARLVLASLSLVAIGYAFTNAVYCGLHPHKASLHDLAAKSMVARVGRESEAAAFAAECDDVCRTRIKLATWPAGTMALVFAVILAFAWADVLPRLNRELPLQRKIADTLGIADFELRYLLRPSRETSERFELNLARAQKERAERGMAPLTTETLRLLPDGRKTYFGFYGGEAMSSPTLVADPRYGQLVRRLPLLADEISSAFPASKDGRPWQRSPVLVEFRVELPLFLYTRDERVWVDLIPPLERANTPPSD